MRKITTQAQLNDHRCDRAERFALYDARGIFCTYVCEACEDMRRKEYRADIFEDAN